MCALHAIYKSPEAVYAFPPSPSVSKSRNHSTHIDCKLIFLSPLPLESPRPMEPATRRINQLPVHKPIGSTEGLEINSKLVTRSHSARVEAIGTKTTPTALASRNKSYRYPTHIDGQIININSSKSFNKSQVWDCGSSLYDSFELNSLNLQLDLAIKGSFTRTLSMPNLHEPCPPNVTTSTEARHQLAPKKSSRVSKSLNKIFRSVFGSSKATVKKDTTTPSPFTKVKVSSERRNGSLYVYDGSKSMRVLTTIPEIQEIDDGHSMLSPDATPAVRRTVSERFNAPSVHVSFP